MHFPLPQICLFFGLKFSNGTSKKLRAPSQKGPSAAVPADVVGLAGVLKRQAVWLVFVFVGADGDDGLSPALRTGCLIPGRTRAEQHPVAVFCWNLQLEKKERKRFLIGDECMSILLYRNRLLENNILCLLLKSQSFSDDWIASIRGQHCALHLRRGHTCQTVFGQVPALGNENK